MGNGGLIQSGVMVNSSEAFQIAQALYHSVTGKAEKLSKRFSENYKIELNDIIQLHNKMMQMCVQWHVIEKSENITIHHVNDNKETFSSIERFKIYDQSQTSPIESIIYEFNLLVGFQNIDKPQPYKIVVRFDSKVAAHQKEMDDIPAAMFIRFFRGSPINIDISYVDYIVARNIISTLDSWVSTVEFARKNKALNFIQKYSFAIGSILGSFLMILGLLACIEKIPEVLSGTGNDRALAKFILVSFGVCFIFFCFGKIIGNFIERKVDRIAEISYIKINVGDSRAVTAILEANKKYTIQSAFSLLLVTAHAIFCGYIATLIFEFFKSN